MNSNKISILKFLALAAAIGFFFFENGPAAGQSIPPEAMEYYRKGATSGDLTDRIDNYLRAVQIDSNFNKARYYLGISYYHQGEYGNAIATLEKTLEKDAQLERKVRPYLLNAHTFLAAEFLQQEQYEQAIAEVNKACQLDSTFAPAYATLGRTYHELNSLEPAIHAMEQSVRLDSTNASVWNDLGKLYWLHEDFSEAVQAYSKALEIQPDLQAARIDRMLAEKDNSVAAWIERSENAMAEIRWADAVAILQKAQAVYPENQDILEKLNQATLARKYFQGLRAFEDENWEKAVAVLAELDTNYRDTKAKLSAARAELHKLGQPAPEEEIAQPQDLASNHADTSRSAHSDEKVSAREPDTTEAAANLTQTFHEDRQPPALKLPETHPFVAFEGPVTAAFDSSRLRSGTDSIAAAAADRIDWQWIIGISGGTLLFGFLFLAAIKIYGLYSKHRDTLTQTQGVEYSELAAQTDATPAEETLSEESVEYASLKSGKDQEQTNGRQDESQQIAETRTILGGIKQVKKIGRYILEKEIGRGSMGFVYKAWDPKLDRTVVIKQVAFETNADQEDPDKLKHRLFREARAAARLNHPNIIIIYDVDDDEAFSYIVMEYVLGQDLKSILAKEGKLPVARAAQIAGQVSSALDFAHDHGIVHRDIKPSNIMVTPDDKIKVADFGVAQLPQFGTLTQTGSVVGTPFYMSPEQIEGQKVDGASDIFSLGVVLYEMLTGVRPFDGQSIPSVIYQVVHKDPPPPSTLSEDLNRAIDDMIDRALAKNPKNRYATAGELFTELKKIEQEFA